MNTVIFSADSDRSFAERCKAHIESFGHIAHVVTDEDMGVPDRIDRGLMGADMARAMCQAMIDRADGGVVARVDADSLMTPSGLEWLSGASEREARGYFEGYATRCSPFSAHVEHLQKVATLLETAKGGACSGCTICLGLRLETECGGKIKRREGIMRWGSTSGAGASKELLSDCDVITLEPKLLGRYRQEALATLWVSGRFDFGV